MVDGCDAVSKIHGTPRQCGGWNAEGTVCFARASRRCASRPYMHLLLMFQEVWTIRNTRHQFTSKCLLPSGHNFTRLAPTLVVKGKCPFRNAFAQKQPPHVGAEEAVSYT